MRAQQNFVKRQQIANAKRTLYNDPYFDKDVPISVKQKEDKLAAEQIISKCEK